MTRLVVSLATGPTATSPPSARQEELDMLKGPTQTTGTQLLQWEVYASARAVVTAGTPRPKNTNVQFYYCFAFYVKAIFVRCLAHVIVTGLQVFSNENTNLRLCPFHPTYNTQRVGWEVFTVKTFFLGFLE